MNIPSVESSVNEKNKNLQAVLTEIANNSVVTSANNNLLANISSDHIQSSNVSNLSYCSNNMQNDNIWKNGIKDLNFILMTVSNFFAQPSTYEIFKVIKN